MEHKRLLSGGVLALCAVFAALALFAAPVLGGKGGFSVRSFSPQGETDGAVEITARFTEAAVADEAVGKKLAPRASPRPPSRTRPWGRSSRRRNRRSPSRPR